MSACTSASKVEFGLEGTGEAGEEAFCRLELIWRLDMYGCLLKLELTE